MSTNSSVNKNLTFEIALGDNTKSFEIVRIGTKCYLKHQKDYHLLQLCLEEYNIRLANYDLITIDMSLIFSNNP